jgi:predicted nucleic acid-binding protein
MSGAILLDTDVLIDYLRDVANAVRLLQPRFAAGDPLAASVVTKAEVLAGMRAGEEQRTVRTLGSLALAPVDDEVAMHGGAFARYYRSMHPGISLADYLIAATAQVLGADLWTQNPRHFPMFEGLEPPYER